MTFFGWDDFQRKARPPPDQDQRLHPETHTDRPVRRTRPWILVVIVVVLVAVFVAIVVAGPDDSPEPMGTPTGDVEPAVRPPAEPVSCTGRGSCSR